MSEYYRLVETFIEYYRDHYTQKDTNSDHHTDHRLLKTATNYERL